MPIQSCSANGTSGFRWGNSGKCYTGPGAKKKAIKQGYAEDPEHFSEEMNSSAELQTTVAEEFGMMERIVLVEAAKMTRKSINDLPDSDFAYIEPGGSKDDSGKTTPRSLRHFPIHDAAHVRNALSRLPQSNLSSEAKSKALSKIKAAAKKFGIDKDKKE